MSSDAPTINIKRGFSRAKNFVKEESEPPLSVVDSDSDSDNESEREVVKEQKDDDDFLADLKNGNIPEDYYVPPSPAKLKRGRPRKIKTPPPSPKFQPQSQSTSDFIEPPPISHALPPQTIMDDDFLANMMPMNKPKTYATKKSKKADDSFFSGIFCKNEKDATPILGRGKRELLQKMGQMKALFPDELSKFKIKPNASESDLEQALTEMNNIVECGGICDLINEAFFTSVAVVENVSSRFQRMDISGCSALLRSNSQVHKLLKLLSIKYNVFSQAPPEAQLLLITVSTAMICRTNNIKRRELNDILNVPL